MTVSDLIAELQKHPPHKPVRVVMDHSERDVDVVRYEGSHVAIETTDELHGPWLR
jgi:hypothetical protein